MPNWFSDKITEHCASDYITNTMDNCVFIRRALERLRWTAAIAVWVKFRSPSSSCRTFSIRSVSVCVYLILYIHHSMVCTCHYYHFNQVDISKCHMLAKTSSWCDMCSCVVHETFERTNTMMLSSGGGGSSFMRKLNVFWCRPEWESEMIQTYPTNNEITTKSTAVARFCHSFYCRKFLF